MTNDDPTARIVKLEKLIQEQSYHIKMLKQSVSLLERENNRRKTEMNQVISALQKLK